MASDADVAVQRRAAHWPDSFPPATANGPRIKTIYGLSPTSAVCEGGTEKRPGEHEKDDLSWRREMRIRGCRQPASAAVIASSIHCAMSQATYACSDWRSSMVAAGLWSLSQLFKASCCFRWINQPWVSQSALLMPITAAKNKKNGILRKCKLYHMVVVFAVVLNRTSCGARHNKPRPLLRMIVTC